MKRAEAKTSTNQGGGMSNEGMSNEGMKLDEFSFSLLYQRLKPLLPTTASGLLQFFHNEIGVSPLQPHPGRVLSETGGRRGQP
jgi:hypothetical protein